jgi:hypothetical protein
MWSPSDYIQVVTKTFEGAKFIFHQAKWTDERRKHRIGPVSDWWVDQLRKSLIAGANEHPLLDPDKARRKALYIDIYLTNAKYVARDRIMRPNVFKRVMKAIDQLSELRLVALDVVNKGSNYAIDLEHGKALLFIGKYPKAIEKLNDCSAGLSDLKGKDSLIYKMTQVKVLYWHIQCLKMMDRRAEAYQMANDLLDLAEEISVSEELTQVERLALPLDFVPAKQLALFAMMDLLVSSKHWEDEDVQKHYMDLERDAKKAYGYDGTWHAMIKLIIATDKHWVYRKLNLAIINAKELNDMMIASLTKEALKRIGMKTLQLVKYIPLMTPGFAALLLILVMGVHSGQAVASTVSHKMTTGTEKHIGSIEVQDLVYQGMEATALKKIGSVEAEDL